MAPPTNCLSPIGEKAILSGLYKQIKGDFYTAVSRPPAVYRGNPFVIEAGLAYGQQPEQAKNTTEESGPAGRRGAEEGDIRTRARHSLREPCAAALPAIRLRDLQGGARHDLAQLWVTQSRGALPAGPMVIFVHMASVWVPFTSESKEAIAEYDEIHKEITLALRECGRRLGVFLRRRERADSEYRRRNIFELYIEEVVEACHRLKGGKLAEREAKGAAPENGHEADRRQEDRRSAGKNGERPRGTAALDHRHARRHRGRGAGGRSSTCRAAAATATGIAAAEGAKKPRTKATANARQRRRGKAPGSRSRAPAAHGKSPANDRRPRSAHRPPDEHARPARKG